MTVKAVDESEEDGNRTLMVIIVASIVGVLVLVVIAMILRTVMQRKRAFSIPDMVKT